MTAPDDEQVSGEIVVTNEFASVVVRKVLTRNGERLEIAAPSSGRSIRLDALVLESLTWSNSLELGKGLRTPFGPDRDEAEGGEP